MNSFFPYLRMSAELERVFNLAKLTMNSNEELTVGRDDGDARADMALRNNRHVKRTGPGRRLLLLITCSTGFRESGIKGL
jgi:hypothetical protein